MSKTGANDPHDLQRFVDAQRAVYADVCEELRTGRKRTHWMWFTFPQIAGLGRSATAIRFALASIVEAKAYLAHPVLGPRLRECARLVNHVEGRSVGEIFGDPDQLKFHSCMTLFAEAAPEDQVFDQALHKYFAGERDRSTLERL